MASSSGLNNTGGDDQDKDFRATKGKDEVFEDMSDDDGEEFQEDQRQYPYATIERIGVTKNPSVFKEKEWPQKAGKGLRRNSAGRSPFLEPKTLFML